MHGTAKRRNAARWAAKHMTDCSPGALSGRADPKRGGRHLHSLRDLEGCSSAAPGPQAAAPLVEVAAFDLADDDSPAAPRNVSPLAPTERIAVGLPVLGRPGTTSRVFAASRRSRRTARVHDDTTPTPAAAPALTWAGITVDVLTGICVVTPAAHIVKESAAADIPPPHVAAVCRAQALSGGVRPGDLLLAPTLLRDADALDDTTESCAAVEEYRWSIVADGDLGHVAAHRRMRCPVLLSCSTEFARLCRAVAGRVAAMAATEVMPWPVLPDAPPPDPDASDDTTQAAAARSPLEAAVLAMILRDPALGERSLARTLAAEGATQGRVYRILQRHGLETRGKRRAWADATAPAAGDTATASDEQEAADPVPTCLPEMIANAARRLSADGPDGLEPLWRYHLAAAWVRVREGLPIPEVLPAEAMAAVPAEAVAAAL